MNNLLLLLLPYLVNGIVNGNQNYKSINVEEMGKVNNKSKNEKIQVIVNCSQDQEYEEELKKIGQLKYKLPMINSYVLEIPQKYIGKLKELKGVEKVEQDTHLTAQMNVARDTINATWADNTGIGGEGVGVAILDTGIYPHKDLVYRKDRIIGFKDFINSKDYPYDDNGHGTHVAGIIGGDGTESNGKYKGVAPGCNLIGIKVLKSDGAGNISDVLAGIQWVLDNRQRYNIRILNLSVGMQDVEGEKSALVKGVNAAWDRGLIVVAAAGNNGPKNGTITTPGVSRKIITVGSSDDAETVNILGDFISQYSGRGPTKECIKKPDVVAPGSNIIACGSDKEYVYANNYPNKDVGYVKKSGTSMATPMVTGCIALLLSRHPNLTNKQVKLKLRESTNDLGLNEAHQGWGLIDVKKFLS